ncbi:MAG TPA: DUF885 domain-containing protein [Bryobacteraceae bacterium]|jgi:uncharacterized protein (DUF885 family)|nr:DUF885 domain-containing protein [Bryobacteraceae bacterium]
MGPKLRPVHARQAPSRSALRQFEDDWWAFYLENNPESATQLGEYQYNNQLSRYSPGYFSDLKQKAAGMLARLQRIDVSKGSEMESLDRILLLGALQDQIKGIDLKTYEMPVDQFNGVQILFPQIATFAPFDTVKHYEDYIARLKQIPERFEEVTESLKLGTKDGLLPPKFLLEKTVDQCQALEGPAGETNPFAAPLKQIPASFAEADKTRIRRELIDVVNEQVRPGYRKLQHFLAVDYAPKGRQDPGIWAVPNGDELYRFAVHTQTTSDLAPEQIHELGISQVHETEAAINTLAKKNGYSSGKEFLNAAKADPNTKAKSREQILNNFRRYIGQMEPKLPELFGLLPKAKLIVTSVPEYMEKEGSTEYIAGTPDGSRPGQVWVDTYDPTHHDMLDDEATAYHEGVPGHHMQVSIAQELPNLHPFHRALQFNAYAEGWALYAERLGKEVGFYQNPESDLGRLQSELFRAVRLVVDTGVHYKHWSREQMVDYFNEHFGSCPQAEVDRYIAWPGQALGYKLGQLKILELRKKAHDELGPKFDIKAFHDEILNAAAVPLNVLDARVSGWIQQQKKTD